MQVFFCPETAFMTCQGEMQKDINIDVKFVRAANFQDGWFITQIAGPISRLFFLIISLYPCIRYCPSIKFQKFHPCPVWHFLIANTCCKLFKLNCRTMHGKSQAPGVFIWVSLQTELIHPAKINQQPWCSSVYLIRLVITITVGERPLHR